MNITRNRLVIGVLVAVGAIASIALGTQTHATTESDCTSNSIMPCGVTSPSDFRAKYNNGGNFPYQNASSHGVMPVSHASLSALYAYFGWTSSIINNSRMVDGYAYPNGEVTINGKVVATNAESAGRWKVNASGIPGYAFTAGGLTYYKNTTANRFIPGQRQAVFVMLDSNGQFIGAIEVACANPISAKPVIVPKPIYTCNAITKEQISRTEYEFNANTSVANGATHNSFVYSFGDGTSQTVGSAGGPVKHTYAKSGTYKVTLTAVFNVNGKVVSVTNANCQTTVTVAPVPVTPVYTCDALQATAVTQSDTSVLTYNFKTTATATGGATVKSYAYDFGDGHTATAGATTSHTYTSTGTYKVSVTVTFTVNGTTKTATSANCQTTVKPYKNVVKPAEVMCTSLVLQTISDNTYNLEAVASATAGVSNKQQAGVISGYTYTIKDVNGNVVKTINKSAGLSPQTSTSGNFSLTTGDYTAQVVVHSNVGDKTSAQCTVKISVPAPNEIKVCRLSDYTIVTINEKDFDASKYSKDLKDCEKVTVCDTTTNQVVTVTKEEAKDSKYTTDLTQCEQVTVCDTTTSQIVKVYPSQIDNNRYTTDLSKCTPTPPVVTPPTQPTPPEQPQPPVELPHTGASNVATSVFGAGSLIAAVSYYVASRRALS